MQTALLVMVVAFSAVLALWPLVFLVAVALHARARRWRRVAELALLLPLWCVAASLGLIQLPRLLNAIEGAAPSSRPGLTIVAVVLSVCLAALAWALLLRAFGQPVAGAPPR